MTGGWFVARGLQSMHARWSTGVVCLVSICALWQVAGCVIPPPEVESGGPNSSPWIDWSLTVPEGVYATYNLGTGGVAEGPMEFSIEGAVFDLEGDDLQFMWYWVAPDDTFYQLTGNEVAVLENLCTYGSIKEVEDGVTIPVHVVVSDHKLRWQGGKEPTKPVDPGNDENGEPLPVITRVWVVGFIGNCD